MRGSRKKQSDAEAPEATQPVISAVRAAAADARGAMIAAALEAGRRSYGKIVYRLRDPAPAAHADDSAILGHDRPLGKATRGGLNPFLLGYGAA